MKSSFGKGVVYPFFNLLDQLFDFSGAFGIELLFIRGEFLEQPQEFPGMHAFLIGDVFEHLDRQFVVRRLGELHVELHGFVLRSHQEPNRPNQFRSGKLPVVGKACKW